MASPLIATALGETRKATTPLTPSSHGFLFSSSPPADDMVNGFQELDARFPTQELYYLTKPEKHIFKA
jgi:hypothetical protein